MTVKKRFAAVGTGGRIPMYIDPLVRDYSAQAELVALCDLSCTRMSYHQQRLMRDYGYHEVPLFHVDDFDRMVQEARPDVVLVCTVDATHHDYIVRALHAGCDVVTEKPMTTDAEKCQAIFEAVKVTGRSVRVAFNYRWGPGPSKVRELLQSGLIGTIHSVNLEGQLNTSHGADYFRRWHSHKENSGGLLVHKSTHHFDLVNWWTNAIPEEVFAWGGLKFYGKENAVRRGDEKLTRYERYSGVDEAQEDPFGISLEGRVLEEEIYLKAEADSGYIRDRNVFREGITIEDTMNVLVKYRGGTVLNYSLVAYSPQEGYRVSFTGERGRIEYSEQHASHIIRGQSDAELAVQQGENGGHRVHLRVIPMFGSGYDVPIVEAAGGHGGGDPLLQRRVFDAGAGDEPLRRDAGHEQGAASILIGSAANASMESGLPVRIEDLCPLQPGAKHLDELV